MQVLHDALMRLADLLIAGFSLVALLPLFTLVGIMIRLESRGGVFFRQERVGRHLRLFRIYKFRSMVADAPEKGQFYTTEGDPRITRVGAFLRRTSLDELPQLLNVLKGEMSLVGPRPNVPAQREQYTEEQWVVRAMVRPGITGLAQIRSRHHGTMEIRTANDLEWVEQRNLTLYIAAILKTALVILKDKSY